MSYTKHNLMILALQILIGLAFAVFVVPNPSLAQNTSTGTNYTFYSGNQQFNQYGYQYQTPNSYSYQYQTPYSYQTPVSQSVYYPTPAQTTRVVYIPGETQTTSTSGYEPVGPAKGARLSQTAENAEDENYSSLAGNAIFGEGGFLPTGLIQWIFVAIMILIIVILARKVFGGAQAYYAAPAKHH